MICTKCDGKGDYDAHDSVDISDFTPTPCDKCGGTGQVPDPVFILPEGANIPKRWIVEENPAEIKVSVPSSSQPGVEYIILILKETKQMFCNCKGFQYRQTCRHIPYLIGFVSKKAKKRGMQDTQLESYHKFTEEELNMKELTVFVVLKARGPSTDRQLAKALDWSINRINGRRNKLVEKNMVEDAGKIWDAETERNVIVWRVKA